MESIIEKQIKNEIFKFNEKLFGLIRGISHHLELDEDTFTIIENSNKLLIFCAVKDVQTKGVGEPVCVIYNEDADGNWGKRPIAFGRSLAQYRKFYKGSKGKCETIIKKSVHDFCPMDAHWSYAFRDFILYQTRDGAYGLCYHAKAA